MMKINVLNDRIENPKFPQESVLSNDNRKCFSFSENKKNYHANNINALVGCRLRIDGKLYSSSDTKKCDFGLLLEDNRFFLIECKGKDVVRALRQLDNTYDSLNNDYKDYKFNFFFRVIAQRGIPESTLSQNLKVKFKNKLVI